MAVKLAMEIKNLLIKSLNFLNSIKFMNNSTTKMIFQFQNNHVYHLKISRIKENFYNKN